RDALLVAAAERFQDRVPGVGRVAETEAPGRRAGDAAPLQVFDRLRRLSQVPPVELIGLVEEGYQPIVRGLRIRPRDLGHGEPDPPRDRAGRLPGTELAGG